MEPIPAPDQPSIAVTVRREDSGWQIRVPRLDLTTWTRSLDDVEATARAAIADALYIAPSAVELETTMQFPGDIDEDLAEVTRWRDISTYAAGRVAMLTRRVADHLVTREHLTQREAASLLGISQQRVAQLLKKPDQG